MDIHRAFFSNVPMKIQSILHNELRQFGEHLFGPFFGVDEKLFFLFGEAVPDGGRKAFKGFLSFFEGLFIHGVFPF